MNPILGHSLVSTIHAELDEKPRTLGELTEAVHKLEPSSSETWCRDVTERIVSVLEQAGRITCRGTLYEPVPVEQQPYRRLNDAADRHDRADLASGATEIWYLREPTSERTRALLLLGSNADDEYIPTPATLEETHIKLGTVASTDPEQLHQLLQGEVWSPEGEARVLIEQKGLSHTSMSVGDVIVLPDGRAMMVDWVGFAELATDASVMANS